MKKTIVTAAILASGSFFTFNPANASNIAKNTIEIISGSENSSVKFTGVSEDALLFNVKIANMLGSKFILTVKSEDGEVLYSKSYNDKQFEKTIKLLKNDAVSRYYFSIVSADKTIEQNYEISTTQRVVDNVTISKL